MKRLLFCIVVALLIPCAAKAKVSVSITAAEGWPVLFADSGDAKHLASTTRIGVAVGIPVADGMTLVIKPRVILGHGELKPQPGLILGLGFKISDRLSWSVGALYQMILPYGSGKVRHTCTLGTGPVVKLSDHISYLPSVFAGRSFDQGWVAGVVPIELAFRVF